jgi:hypothetical protein
VQKILTVSRSRFGYYNCTIIAPWRKQKWLKAYVFRKNKKDHRFTDGQFSGFVLIFKYFIVEKLP